MLFGLTTRRGRPGLRTLRPRRRRPLTGFYNYLFNYFDRVTRYVLDGVFSGAASFDDTLFVANDLSSGGSISAVTDVTAGGSFTYDPASTVEESHPFSGVDVLGAHGDWEIDTSGRLVTSEINSTYRLILRLPCSAYTENTTVTKVRLGCTATGAGGTATVTVRKQSTSLATGVVTSTPSSGADATSSGTGWQVLDTGTISLKCSVSGNEVITVDISTNGTAGTRTLGPLIITRTVAAVAS